MSIFNTYCYKHSMYHSKNGYCEKCFSEFAEKLPSLEELVNHPKHYNDGKIEVIEFIEDKNLNFHLGNAVKYISRAGKKDPNKTIEDLNKAIWYIKRQIELLNSANQGRGAIKPNEMKKE